MTDLALTRDEARWLAVIAQGLDRRPFRRRPTKADVLSLIERIGCLQLDTISVISRSHETVLWSRLGPYDVQLIANLYDPGLALTEYLAHAAAIIPTTTLPLFRGYMEMARSREGWAAEPDNRAVMDRILAHMEQKGTVSSRDFEAPADGRKVGPWEWYGTKPERRALDALWVRGETVLRRREAGFSRVFDLPERVVPELWNGDPVAPKARTRAFVGGALRALGVTTAKWASDYFRTGGQAHVPAAKARTMLDALVAEGRALRVTVPGIAEPVWMDAALRERLELLRERKGRPVLTTLLSPFDNLIWNRSRGEQLWDFHYRLECYTGPKATVRLLLAAHPAPGADRRPARPILRPARACLDDQGAAPGAVGEAVRAAGPGDHRQHPGPADISRWRAGCLATAAREPGRDAAAAGLGVWTAGSADGGTVGM